MGSIADSKEGVIRQLLQDQDYVLLVVDTRCEGVKLPEHLIAAGKPVGINVGWRMAIPVPDMRIDRQGISGTLSFKQVSHYCKLPWPAIMQVTVGDEHMVWVTPHALSVISRCKEEQAAQPAPLAKKTAPRKKRAHLRLVD